MEFSRGVFSPAQMAGMERGIVHAKMVQEPLKTARASYKIGLSIALTAHANFPAGVNVVPDQSLAGFPLRLLLRRHLALAAQDIDGAFDIALGLSQRVAAIAETRTRAFAQLFDQLRGYIGLLRVCRHFGKSSNDDQIWLDERSPARARRAIRFRTRLPPGRSARNR